MFAHSLRFFLSLCIVVTLLSFHLGDVQSMSIPDMVASLASRRNIDSRNDQVDEEDELKILSKLLDKARNKKSVTFQDEDFDNGDEGVRRAVGPKRNFKKQGSQSFEEWKRAYLVKSPGSIAGRETQEQKDNLHLKDRDYFQAIGLSPGGYQSYNSYPSHSYSNNWDSDEY